MWRVEKIILCAAFFLALGSVFAGMAAGGETPGSRLSVLHGPAFERAFYSEALPYHEAAAAMSRLAIARTKDPLIEKYAEEVIRTMATAVEELRLEAEKRGGVDKRLYGMARDETSTMMKQAFSDRRYAEQMTQCFKQVIEMAKLAPDRTEDARLLELAKRMTLKWQDMLGEFEAWMAK